MDRSHIFKGVLLVSGTSIGGGMLALPVLTSLTGFIPSLFVYLACWLFMAATGLLLLEVCIWMHADANLVTMAERTLGPWGKRAAWGLYLFLFYCLTLAYIEGCGDILANAVQHRIPDWLTATLFTLVFGSFVIAGARLASHLNVWLMLGLGIAYCLFVILGYPYVQGELLLKRNWSLMGTALPIAFTAFAYQGIIPTLVTYMKRDIPSTRLVIIIGSFLPLIVYVIWQALILGIVPVDGPGGLSEALDNGENAVQPLKQFLNNPRIYLLGQFFAFFALVTSFIGVTLGLVDFLSDGLRIEKTSSGKCLLGALVFLPPLLFAIFHKGIFLIALSYAGGFGCALLLGLLPICMVWAGRYQYRMKGEQQLPGGRALLLLLIAFVLIELWYEIRFIVS